MSKKTIYIAGKITGVEDLAKIVFKQKELELEDIGYNVINPMELKHDHDKTHASYMRVCIKALCECDEIYMLSNWTDSKGAIIEHTIAMYLGLKVQYEAVS